MASSVRVYVQKDGVVLHEHPGAKGLHGPWIRHGTDLHKDHKVTAAHVVKDLSEPQKAQYREALAGKSFAFMWENRKKTDGTWSEQRRGAAPGTRKAELAKATQDAVRAEELTALEDLAIQAGLRD